jgi:DNA excision repair protein ERCC-8
MNSATSSTTRGLRRCKDAFLQLELGLVSPAVFQKRLLARRMADITLDPSTTIQREHAGSVNTIDIEEAEGR